METWLVLGLIVLAYGALVIILRQTGLFDRAGIEMRFGIVFWRSKRGIALMERIAKARRLWGAFGRLSVVLVFAVMALMVLTLLVQTAFITRIPADAVDPQLALGIPGINPIIPLGFGVIGLAVAIIVHEGCHGILARLEGVKVRSVGLIVAVFPIGAFVEPDEREMRAAALPKRLRIYGVGPSSNILLALVCAAVFSAGFMGSLQPVDDGVVITTVYANTAAGNASIQPFTLVDMMQNGSEPIVDIHGTADFEAFMAARHTNDTVYIYGLHDGQPINKTVVLGERVHPTTGQTVAFLGVVAEAPETFTTLARPGAAAARFCGGEGQGFGSGCYARAVAFYLGMPLRGDSPAAPERQMLYAPTGALAGLGSSFWPMADLFYWLFWLNFMVGTFNALPLKPLDGGHMFQDAVLALLRRRAGPQAQRDEGATVRAQKIAGIESDLAMMEGEARRASAMLGELKAASGGADSTAESRKELADAEREARETQLEVARLKELLEIEKGKDVTPEDDIGAKSPPPPPEKDEPFGPQRFRDALDRRAYRITNATSLLMLALILLPFIVPKLLGTPAS